MNEKKAKYLRAVKKKKQEQAKAMMLELYSAPFKYRFKFCMKLLFRKGIKG